MGAERARPSFRLQAHLACAGFAWFATMLTAQGGGGGGGRGGNQEARDRSLQRTFVFRTEVPARDADVLLARPTDRSVTVSVAAWVPLEVAVEYWRVGETARRATEPVHAEARQFPAVELRDLAPGTAYRYRLLTRRAADATPVAGEEHGFRTRPQPGTPFTFTVQADSHLDANVDPKVYERTLANALADQPDFHVDLGDTFMTDKRRDFRDAAPQYDAQRYYFGQLCHSAPLLMALGNHDGESGTAGSGAEDMGPWSYAMRTQRFPPPRIDGDGGYTGRTAFADGRGGNWFAFAWGDALCVVLDPFWNTDDRPRGGGAARGNAATNTDFNWTRSLGRAQYDWLTATLAGSKARYAFVFIHHLVGGYGKDARGGVESAPFFEWGGKNADGSDGFAGRRPGWAMPIHDLLVKHGVQAVFHGHDHMYVRSELGGLVYQCVPQPGNPGGGTRSAEEYGYRSGTILGSPGYLRIRVAPDAARVEFVRSSLGAAQQGPRRDREPNGTVVHSYELPPRAQAAAAKKS